MFVVGLRKTYKEKVQTFRHVIDVHQVELCQKQQYWDNALKVGISSLFSRRLGLSVQLVIWFFSISKLNSIENYYNIISKSSMYRH